MTSHYDLKMPRTAAPWVRDADGLAALYPGELVTVTARSPLKHRQAVESVAKFFRREFHYDFVQYRAVDEEPNCTAYLWRARGWLGESNTVVGGCCFRWVKWRDAPDGWSLSWIWLHPYERRRGRLTEAWPYFRAKFGDFHIERPVSSAMQGFLKKINQQAPINSDEVEKECDERTTAARWSAGRVP